MGAMGASRDGEISYPESSGFLVGRWAPEETLENAKKNFCFDWLPRNGLHCFTAVSHGHQPLAKELEDSGYEIGAVENLTLT